MAQNSLLVPLYLLFAFFSPGAAVAQDAPALAAALDVVARPPRVGEWVEYRVAFPADPLENSLRTDPVPLPQVAASPPADGEGTEDEYEYFIKPSFNPPVAWRVLPLRLEIQKVDATGCEAFLSFAGARRLYHLPIAREKAKAEFNYESPQPDDRRDYIQLDGGDYEITVTRRTGDGYGFVRWSGAEPPFGLFRFATEDVDLILVAMGEGEPPAFPLEPKKPITPPPGLLYRGDNEFHVPLAPHPEPDSDAD